MAASEGIALVDRDAAGVDRAFRADVLAGLRQPQKAVPARWFYDDAGSQLFYMVKVENARFSKQVVPGDVLILDVRMKRLIRNMGWYSGEAKVNGEVVAEGRLTAAVVDRSAMP